MPKGMPIGPRVSIYACLDTLEYLYRGGRISKEKKILSTVLNIKPILSFRYGELTLPAKVRGIKRGIRTICDFIDADGVDTKYPVLLMYTNLMDNGMALMSELRTRKYPVAIRNIFNAGGSDWQPYRSQCLRRCFYTKQLIDKEKFHG